VWDGGNLRNRFDEGFKKAPGEMNYYEHIQDLYPDPENGSPEEKLGMKNRRKKFKISLTEPGHPGEALRPQYEKYLSMMRVSETVAGSKRAKELHCPEFHHLLPSFFHCVLELSKAGRDFRVIFRTFGVDLENVKEEWNAFCEGTHPSYPDARFDGTSGSRDLRLKELTSIFRVDGPEEVHVFVNGLRENGSDCNMDVVAKNCERTFTGFENFYEYLKSGDTLGINDDYWYWRNRNEKSMYGKLFMLDPEDDTTHCIFFDDNMDTDDALIVDARDVRTGSSLPYSETKNVYLHGVNCLGAIGNKNYYLDAVEQCEANRRKN